MYLIGRNLTLLAKAGVVAARADARRIALGPLAGNPFPDATPAFFAAMAEALSRGLAHAVSIATPFLALHKHQVIELGARLGVPFELTLSCMQPDADRALRTVQQVPRTARRVHRGRGAGSHQLRAARAARRGRVGGRVESEDPHAGAECGSLLAFEANRAVAGAHRRAAAGTQRAATRGVVVVALVAFDGQPAGSSS